MDSQNGRDPNEFKYYALVLIGAAVLLALFFLSGCTTLRAGPITGINFTSQPARALIKSTCQGTTKTVQGIFACEEKIPIQATASVKVPPAQGRVIFSDGLIKQTADFNWYPTTGFFIWKKQQISDTWLNLDLKSMDTDFGDWPIALDVEAQTDIGVIVTRGIIYHRICDDKATPCSSLSYSLSCGISATPVVAGQIGACQQMQGALETVNVPLPKGTKSGGKLYTSVSRMGIAQTQTVAQSDLDAGYLSVLIPSIPTGPTLIELRFDFYDDAGKHSQIGHSVILGFDPNWVGLDTPHALQSGSNLEFVKPVTADVFETVNISAGAVTARNYSTSANKFDVAVPTGSDTACAFAWGRVPSDVTSLCYNSNLDEVTIP